MHTHLFSLFAHKNTLNLPIGMFFLLFAFACSDGLQLAEPKEGDSCAKEGERLRDAWVCTQGTWSRVNKNMMNTSVVDMGGGTRDQGQVCDIRDEQDRCAERCGEVQYNDACGQTRTATCNTCMIGFACVQGKCEELKGCETKEQLCERVEARCGQINELDNCGDSRQENCGGCQGQNDECVNNKCVCQPEIAAQTCARAGKTCGSVTLTNNCGQMVEVDCGTCSKGDCEADNTCSQCDAETKEAFCTRLGKTCGSTTAPDACTKQSRTESCGTCDNDRVCSAQGTCECPEVNCSQLECGDASNACGQSKDCGDCGANQLCSNNICVCEPETDEQLCANSGANCGTISVTDRCQRRRDITCGKNGNCNDGNVCNNNLCCRPQTDAQLCASNGLSCGAATVTDNCGQTRMLSNCGTCSSVLGVTCQQNQCVCNESNTLEELCANYNVECGMATVLNKCQQPQTINCGMCRPNKTCVQNKCF